MRRIKNAGFTLAEVLITLTIIGLVASLTIPQLVKNMTSYVFAKSKEITLAKITEATNQMRSNDVLSDYTSNDAFASEFQKYMKVTKRCDSSNLTECFPAKFKTIAGDEINTSSLTSGTTLGANNISDGTVGLMLANGTSVLMTLRDPSKVGTDCVRIEPTNNTSDTTSCLSFIYDTNGAGQPNIVGKDIAMVRADINLTSCVTVGALCVATEDEVITPISEDPFNSNDNYWAGARDACLAKGMQLPTMAQLATMHASKDALGMTATLYFTSEVTNATTVRDVFFVLPFPSYGSTTKDSTTHAARCIK